MAPVLPSAVKSANANAAGCVQVVKKHKNCHQAYIDRLVSEATVTEDEIDTTHSRIQKILQARRTPFPEMCMRSARAWPPCVNARQKIVKQADRPAQAGSVSEVGPFVYRVCIVTPDARTCRAAALTAPRGLQEEFDLAKEYKPQKHEWLSHVWTGFMTPAQRSRIRNTGAHHAMV